MSAERDVEGERATQVDRPICGAMTTKKTRCRQPVIPGLSRCSRHLHAED